jgi:flagellum-specific peptidoglycan hydrolase FlgJ
MALLGSSVDPRLFVQDFSGFTRAADIQGQSMANLGGQIGQGVKDFAQASQERKKLDAETKATRSGIESAIKLGDALGFDVKGMLSPVLAQMDDPNTTPMQAAALGREAANQISNVLNFGFKAQEFDLQKQELGMRQADFDAKRNAPAPQAKKQVIQVGSGYFSVDPQSGTASPIMVQENKIPEPISKFSNAFSEYGQKYNIDPNLLAAISIHETGGGKSSAFRNKNNLMGVSDSKGPISFERPEESIERMARLIGQGVNEKTGPYANVTDIDSLANIYAPVGADNDPKGLNKHWADSVKGIYESLQLNNAQGSQLSAPEESEGVMMTPAQLQEQIASGMKVNWVPAEGGNYLVTGGTAGGGPLVNVNTGSGPQQQRETAIDKSLIETKAEAAQAADQLFKVEEVSKLLDEGVKTGFAQDVLMKAGRIFGKDVSNQEAFKAASGNIAMGFVNLTKGSISDREMQYFTEVLAPNIGTSVEGNKKITDFLRRASQKAAKVEQIILSGMRAGKSAFDIDDEVQKFRNTTTLVPKEEAPASSFGSESQNIYKEFGVE